MQKPDSGEESRFLPTRPALDAPLGGPRFNNGKTRDVKAPRPKWPRGQHFGLGLVNSGLGLALASGSFGLGLEILVSASNFRNML